MPGGAASAVAALDLGIGHWAIAKDALAAQAPPLRWAPDHGAGRLAVPVIVLRTRPLLYSTACQSPLPTIGAGKEARGEAKEGAKEARGERRGRI
jgi:hypothetical protein